MNATGDEKYRVWDSYWQDNRVLTAGPDANPDIAANFDGLWTRAAAALPDGARILDLACGNGCVALIAARAFQSAGRSCTIDGIDAADIDPKRYLTKDQELLARITFHAKTPMEKLPFEAKTFDAIFSQFGIEFGDLAKSSSEVGRTLKSGGVIMMLTLAAGTALVQQLDRKARQSRHILANTKLFDVAVAVAQAIHVFETKGEGREPRQYLQRFSSEVEAVMKKLDDGDAGSAIAVATTLQNILTERKNIDLKAQIEAIATLRARLNEHVVRSEAVVRSALGDASVTSLTRRLTEAGIRGIRPEPITIGAHGTVAWRFAGTKD